MQVKYPHRDTLIMQFNKNKDKGRGYCLLLLIKFHAVDAETCVSYAMWKKKKHNKDVLIEVNGQKLN